MAQGIGLPVPVFSGAPRRPMPWGISSPSRLARRGVAAGTRPSATRPRFAWSCRSHSPCDDGASAQWRASASWKRRHRACLCAVRAAFLHSLPPTALLALGHDVHGAGDVTNSHEKNDEESHCPHSPQEGCAKYNESSKGFEATDSNNSSACVETPQATVDKLHRAVAAGRGEMQSRFVAQELGKTQWFRTRVL